MFKKRLNLKNAAMTACLAVIIVFSDCKNDIKNEFTVSFDSNEGSAIPAQIVKEGKKVIKPEDPTRSGYVFVAWYKEKELTDEWEFDTDAVTADITLYAKWVADEYALTNEEMKLYDIMMEYRKEKGLADIPISKSLTYVAHIHVKDLQENARATGCNMHSWSDKGSWTPCCYTSDHAQASCMWRKPGELTSYTGYGYEIAYWRSSSVTPESALNSWKNSSGHNTVIINEGSWTSAWRAVGIGISKNYAVVWFGRIADE